MYLFYWFIFRSIYESFLFFIFNIFFLILHVCILINNRLLKTHFENSDTFKVNIISILILYIFLHRQRKIIDCHMYRRLICSPLIYKTAIIIIIITFSYMIKKTKYFINNHEIKQIFEFNQNESNSNFCCFYIDVKYPIFLLQ